MYMFVFIVLNNFTIIQVGIFRVSNARQVLTQSHLFICLSCLDKSDI
jgi:hypothetical protein